MVVGVFSASTSCSDECGRCTETHETYRISGEAPAGAQCSTVILTFYEGMSSRCSAECMASSTTPGGLVLEENLGSSSTWSVEVAISYVEARPGLEVYAFCDANQNGRTDTGDPCVASTSVAAGSHDGVTFDEPSCPGRL